MIFSLNDETSTADFLVSISNILIAYLYGDGLREGGFICEFVEDEARVKRVQLLCLMLIMLFFVFIVVK